MSHRTTATSAASQTQCNDVRRAAIYTRVSSVDQLDNFSLSSQERACRAYCASHGWEVDAVFEEQGESAKTADRPALKKLLTFCGNKKNPIGFVVVYSINRVARQTHDHLGIRKDLARNGVKLRSVTENLDETPSGRMVETVIAASAQYDNEVRSARSQLGLKDAVIVRGKFVWPAPLGYRNGRESESEPSLVPDPLKAHLVRRAFELVASGVPRAEARRQVQALGLQAHRGGELSAQSFNCMFKNHAYRGWIQVKKWGATVYKGDFQPLVDETTFWIAQKRIAPTGIQRVEYRRDHPDFPLRGVVCCGQCGGVLTGSNSVNGKSARHYGYYHCFRKGCGGIRVPKYILEQEFDKLLAGVTPKPEYLSLFRHIVLDVWKSRTEAFTSLRTELRRRVDEMMAKKDRIFDGYDSRKIDEETYHRQSDRADADLAQAQLALAEASGEETDVESVVGYACEVLRDAGSLWKGFGPDQRRRFLRIIFPEGVKWVGEGFGTVATSSVFGWLRDLAAGESGLVAHTGFEPVLPP